MRDDTERVERSHEWLVAMVLTIASQPALYVGDETVRTFSYHLYGYLWARSDLGLPVFGGRERGLLARFARWLKPQTGLSDVEFVDHIEHIDGTRYNFATFALLFTEFLREERLSALLEDSRGRWPPPSASRVPRLTDTSVNEDKLL